VRHLIGPLLDLGWLGLLFMGVADSSFLVLPFGNDLLVVILVASEHNKAVEFVPTAALGSVLGMFLLDLVCRKSGEAGLSRMMNPKRFSYLKRKVGGRAAMAIAVACLAPPPFPFTAVIAAASAFQYPRAKLLATAFLARLVRYSLVAWAAIHWGTEILRFAGSNDFVWGMIGFSVLCVVASTISVMRWLRRGPSRKTA
jgi:membrane protein YqaA with SNARE-associated domain